MGQYDQAVQNALSGDEVGEYMSRLGNFIKASRVKVKLSQFDVAKLFDLKSSQFISNIERGLADLPPAYFKKVAVILGVDANKLVELYFKDQEWRLRREFDL